METTVPVFVALACFIVSPALGVSYLDGAFLNATQPIPPLDQLYYYPVANGTFTKQLITDGVVSYLATMDEGIGYQGGNSGNGVLLTMEHLMSHLDSTAWEISNGVNTSFDWLLPGITVCYWNFTNAVLGGLNSTEEGNVPLEAGSPAGWDRDFPIWSMDEVFVHLPEMVTPELERVRSWAIDFINAGIDAAIRELPSLMEKRRQESLYPMAYTAQLRAYNVHKVYNPLFQQHSSSDIYSAYAEARDELLALDVISLIDSKKARKL
ncbi:uncharacterized protein LOC126215221 isoform X2 [Schistocerca nitens]|uniref:uncharacterized protein LOC126215221 isoform X2 n=1 Tax=Schistocerca nitens TaxID=7011 RepID=UPI00211881C3|nr:uncharacterized protein LOC126215221 isoform X2 [Schistocerca nitens]